ncbi:MAG: hypothetical protein IIA35_05090, partial [Proteobacteria bacterium]|nr:hypothetical protein [Pseudomonadota bacterium]
MAPRNDVSTDQVAYVNARLLDPATDLDAAGGVLTDGEAITDFGKGVTKKKAPKGARIVDCHGKCLSPGLVDIRVELGDLAATVEAAVSGGVTSMVCLPTPELVIDDSQSAGQVSVLTGAVPIELWELKNLKIIILSNHDLVGSIPPELGRLPRLRVLHLDDNNLSCPLPAGLAGIPTLARLDVSGNNLG